MVTGRELEDLLRVFPRCDLFEWVVAENGCLLYHPATEEQLPLHEPTPSKFIEALRARGVQLTVGRVICAAWVPHEIAVLEAIRECGLDAVIFNKGAVMILPPGHNKASGLAAALDKMGLLPRNAVGSATPKKITPSSNLCLCLAVANALPLVQEKADFVTKGKMATGWPNWPVNDQERFSPTLKIADRHHLLIAIKKDGAELRIPTSRANRQIISIR